MFLQFITRFIRPLGLFAFFIFAVLSIFATVLVRDINSGTFITSFLDYTISFENRFYDFRMKSQINPNLKSKEILLVKIDDYSLEKMGVWPIPRNNYAMLLDKLAGYGAKVVAFDVFFPEKSPNYGDVSPDTNFAEAIKRFQETGRVFLGYSFAFHEKESLAEAPLEMLNDAILTRSDGDMLPKKISRYTFPIKELLSTESGVGSISAEADPDGVFRQYQLIANVETIYYGSLGYNAFEAFTGKKNTIRIFKDASGELEINGKKIELSPGGETKIRYIGSQNQFDSLSLYDLINAKDNDLKLKSLLQGRIVFVGSTAQGAHDFRNSPIDATMPGVFTHMNIAHMLLHQHFFQNFNASVKYSILLLCLGMLTFIFFQRLGNPFIDAFVILVVASASYFADKYYFLPEGYELKLFFCYFCFTSCYMWNTFIKFYESNKEKKQIRGTFARYVAPTIVDEMLKNPELLQVGGTKKDITCLFSDVRDFTSISEGMSATELAHSLNLYMGAMTDIVFDTKGTLDKYIGDAIVAIWGAPLEIGNHAQLAVEGAIKMMSILPSINEEFTRLGRPEFHIGIGLNSGECSVGNMGSKRIFSYTALGDNMNLGARLEGLCKYYGTQILISEMTLSRLDLTNIKTRPIDKVIVKGKTTAVEIHEVLHPDHWMSKDTTYFNLYLSAHKNFQEKNFQKAFKILEQLVMANEKDKPSKRFIDICQKYLEHPELITETFDITTMTEK